MKTAKLITQDDWQQAIQALGINESIDDPNAKTCSELAILWNCHRATAVSRIKALVTLNKAEQVSKEQVNSIGRRIRIVAYRLIKGTK